LITSALAGCIEGLTVSRACNRSSVSALQQVQEE
jgi:hypothetical protein